MDVQMKLKFNGYDLVELCLKRAEQIECPCEGAFEGEQLDDGSVVLRFVPGAKQPEILTPAYDQDVPF